eukprot:gb/GEZN01003585.1/.p1 GENE.gb/GEZN01003585.1/~~gb/GEZN01003585.1/.p1  ORF type:complete len:515 (-),score=103.97 gb/GEZN01003585.1/:475-2019(-)
MLSSTKNPVVSSLYRSLLRTSRQLDRNPALKSLVTRQNIQTVYDAERDRWLEVPLELEDSSHNPTRGERQFKDYLSRITDKWMAALLSGGMHYRPGVELTPIIKLEFRRDLDWGETAAARQSAGFAALRVLGEALERGRSLGISADSSLGRTAINSQTDEWDLTTPLVLRPVVANRLPKYSSSSSSSSSPPPPPPPPFSSSSSLSSSVSSSMSSFATVPRIVPGSTFLCSNLSWTLRGGGAPVILMVSETDGLVVNQPLFSLSHLMSVLTERMSSSEVLARLFAHTGGATTPLQVTGAADQAGETAVKWEDVEIFSKNRVFQGGPLRDGHLTLLHSFPLLPGARRLSGSEHLCIGGDITTAASWVRQGTAEAHQFKLIFGSAKWTKNRLQGEMLRNFWYVARGQEPSTSRLALATPEKNQALRQYALSQQKKQQAKPAEETAEANEELSGNRSDIAQDTTDGKSPASETLENAHFARFQWRSAVRALGGEFEAIADAPFSLLPPAAATAEDKHV